VTAKNKEATMNNGAANHAVTHPVTPAQIKVAGLAGDLYSGPDGRPPLVLLNGLTYGRDIWQPVLGHLGRIDPGRQVLNLDLPGHGDSPDQLPHGGVWRYRARSRRRCGADVPGAAWVTAAGLCPQPARSRG
jgi:pimeloyl-ACP methyl ester carboxylesterase